MGEDRDESIPVNTVVIVGVNGEHGLRLTSRDGNGVIPKPEFTAGSVEIDCKGHVRRAVEGNKRVVVGYGSFGELSGHVQRNSQCLVVEDGKITRDRSDSARGRDYRDEYRQAYQ